jgi:endonuclease-3
MVHEREEEILKILEANFNLPRWIFAERNPFETLIMTIISQNTTDKNAERAYENLSKKFPITPEAFLKAKTSDLENCLKTAGLYRAKAATLKKISKIIIEKFGGELKHLFSLPLEEARETLMQLPGVGPKTADVVLLFCAKKPTLPVDTHVNRVSKRLGLAPADGNYEDVRRSLQVKYKPEDYLKLHILLILLGRKYCKARNPKCLSCPLNHLCTSSKT